MQQLEDPMLALLILRLLHAGEKERQKIPTRKGLFLKKKEKGILEEVYINIYMPIAFPDRKLDSFGPLVLEIRDKFFDSIEKIFQTSDSISKSCCDHLFLWIKGAYVSNLPVYT